MILMEHAVVVMMDIFWFKPYVLSDLYPQLIHIVSAIKMEYVVNAQEGSIYLIIHAIWSILFVKLLTTLLSYANSAILVLG
jgi:hypothetical protein